jgi:hypothetical protein
MLQVESWVPYLDARDISPREDTELWVRINLDCCLICRDLMDDYI